MVFCLFFETTVVLSFFCRSIFFVKTLSWYSFCSKEMSYVSFPLFFKNKQFMLDQMFQHNPSNFFLSLGKQWSIAWNTNKLPNYFFIFQKFSNFWSIFKEHFIKHKHLISEKCLSKAKMCVTFGNLYWGGKLSSQRAWEQKAHTYNIFMSPIELVLYKRKPKKGGPLGLGRHDMCLSGIFMKAF